MIKKSFLALFTSIIIGGLLMVWGTNAMTYTVNWDTSNIAIPAENQAWSTIKRCSNCETETINSDFSSTWTTCVIEPVSNINYIKCTHTYSSAWEYQVTFTAHNNSFDNLYLNGANITSISNFNGINTISNLYLQSNPNFSLSSYTFSNIKITNLYLDRNTLSEFWTSLPNSNQKISLTHNSYTTIVPNIRELRDSYNIKLSDSIIYPNNNSYDKEIDLSHNPIKFVWITKVNSCDIATEYFCTRFYETTSYNFERFGYDSGNISLTYDYEVLQNYTQIENGIAETNSKTIETPLNPWTYTFRVCLHNSTEHCDETTFTVDYSEGITIINPQNNQKYGSLNNIQWKRWRSWNYPISLLSWYEYTLKKWSEIIKEWSINISDTDESCGQGRKNCVEINIGNIIENEVNENNLNGEYTLTVYLIDKDWNYATSNGSRIDETTNFSINIADELATLTINKPADEVSTQTIEFEWNWTFPPSSHTYLLDHYEYTVTWPHSYSTWGSTNDTSFQLQNLSDGSYTFTVTMYYTDNSKPKSVTSTQDFNMTASESPNLSITSPISWANITGTNATEINIPFTWNWWATLFHRYHYTLKDSSNHELTGWNVTINDASHRQFSYNLWNGTYTFEVKMYNSSNAELKSDSSTFTVNIPTTLNIISPTSGNHSSATTTFSWEWFTPYTFTNYEYTVTWPNGFSVWPTTTDGTSFSLQNLRDGQYVFTVKMHYNNWSSQTLTKTRNFTINASAWANLTITSPNRPTYTWNYIKTVPINFTWNWWGSTLISKYNYKLINTITNEIKAQGSVDKNAGWSYSIPTSPLSLPSGTYKFEVTMLDDENNPIIDTVSHTFNVVIPSYLEILTPPAWQLSIKNVNFTWSWFAEFEHHYKYEVNRVDNQGNIISTIKSGNNISLSTRSFSLQNLHNGKYTFSVELMDNSNHPIIEKERTFRIPDDLDLILDISDWNSSVTTLRSKKWIFSWGWRSEDFAGYSYSIQGTTFKNEPFIYTWTSEWVTTWSITLNDLSTGRYRFSVNMLNANGWIITWKHIDFNVVIPASLKIISPTSWSTITSSSATFKWDWYSDVITRYEYSLTSSGWYNYNWFTTTNTFNRNDLTNWNYTLVVRLASGTNFVAQDTVHFTVSIPKKTSWWGWWWSSSKSHPTNDLSVSITNDEPTTNERVEVVVDIDDKYTWKVDFTKMQYYSFDEEKWIDIPVTSKNYVNDYSDDAKLGYVKFDSSDDWEKNLSEFLKFSQPGNYRIHVEDKDWYNDYVQFYVWKWNNKTQLTNTKESEDEYYIARSCKKYKLEYLNDLWVRSSPNLKKDEYFISKDYFKRYIDSKNKRADWCPTNIWWISTTYKDTSNSSERYAAPNGKVYFIDKQDWNFSSSELDKELNGAKKFSTINELKYFIRDRNPFISMAKLWPITIK